MARKSTIRLLLINESENEGERLISVFRNAGRVARSQRAKSLEDLRNLLAQEEWDLLIADDKHPEISIEQALEQLQKSQSSVPAVIIKDHDANALIEAGASDVVSSNDEQRLVLVAFRELEHLENQRALNQLKDKLSAAEERSALLMAQAQDAIAYVADGMLIGSNELFASRFGYENADDLDCAPVIDLIDSADQEKFKGLLKAQTASGEGNTDFSFTGVRPDGETFSAVMQLSNAVVDDEPCIQLSVRDPGAAASGGSGSPDRDYLTDLFSAPYLLSQVDSAAKQAGAGAGVSCLLFIAVDQFEELRRSLGINRYGRLMRALAEHIAAQQDNGCLARYCDDGFGLLLPDTNADKAETIAQSLSKSIREHTLEVDDQSLQCTASIGVVAIDGQIEADAKHIVEHAFSAASEAAEESPGSVVVSVPTKEKKSLGDASSDAELDKILEEALEDDQFVLIYQPVVSLRGASGDHYEVRTHMIKEDGTEVNADEFLHTVEFGQANTRLDRWIILEASKQLSTQIDSGNDTRLFINLTANALRDESLVAWLGVALKAGGIPADTIAFQFQESELLKHVKPAKVFSKAIKQAGCKISITNFGSNEGALGLLKELKADFVKVANQFTQDMLSGSDTRGLKEMVTVIGEFESQSIIGGVENAAALAQLWQLGVDYIQGVYLAGPSRKMDYEFTDIA